MSVSLVDENADAFLIDKLEESFIEKHPLKMFELDVPDEKVKSISKNWLSLLTLEEEYKYNPVYVENIRQLRNTYAGWRKVRGDGNCYYRSVISSYVLKILHPKRNRLRLFQFIKLLNEIDETYPWDFKKSKANITRFFTMIYNDSDSKSKMKNNFITINERLQDEEFDLDLVRVARMISHYALVKKHRDQVIYYILEDEEGAILNNLLSMGTEAEGIELMLCPLGLDIIVDQVNIFDKLLFNTFPEAEEGCKKPRTSIISKRRGHYDILYKIQDMEDDEYCLINGCYYLDPDE